MKKEKSTVKRRDFVKSAATCAAFAAAGDLIDKDQSHKHKEPTKKLEHGALAINLE